MRRFSIQDIIFMITLIIFVLILTVIPNLATANPYPCDMSGGIVCRTEGSLQVIFKNDKYEIRATDNRPANISYCTQVDMVCINKVDNQVDFYQGCSTWIFNKPQIRELKK